MSPGIPHRDALIPFGLELIDAQTQGLIRDKLYLLHGPHGALKTSLALHFLYEGLKDERRSVYVTSQDPEAILLQSDRLGVNLRPYLRRNRLTLLTYLPRISQHIALVTDYRRVIHELLRLADGPPLDRVVFDPIEMLVAQENKVNILPATRLLIDALKSVGATTLCLVDDSDDPQHQVLLKEFLFLAFGALHLEAHPNSATTLRFQKVIWNPRDYPRLPIVLKAQHGVQTIELLEADGSRAVSVTPPNGPDTSGRFALSGAAKSSRNDAQDDALSSGRRLNLLLIDDDEIYLDMLQDFLRGRYEITPFSGQIDDLLRLSKTAFDVIMLNMNLPDIDCEELCSHVRGYFGPVPLVAFSNKLKRGADIAGVLRLGADTFISRPLVFNQVKATLEAVLRRPASADQFARARNLGMEIERSKESLRNIISIDPVTGLTPSDYFEKRLCAEIAKARIGESSFAVVSYSFSLKKNDLMPSTSETTQSPHSIAQSPLRIDAQKSDPQKNDASKSDAVRVDTLRSIQRGNALELNATALDAAISAMWRPLVRTHDMVLQYAPGFYLVYLQECNTPGVKKFNERLRKALLQKLPEEAASVQHSIVIFPTDADDYETLLAKALKPLRGESNSGQ